jgi:hypothetical protein
VVFTDRNDLSHIEIPIHIFGSLSAIKFDNLLLQMDFFTITEEPAFYDLRGREFVVNSITKVTFKLCLFQRDEGKLVELIDQVLVNYLIVTKEELSRQRQTVKP